MEPLGETVSVCTSEQALEGRRKMLITARVLQFSFAPTGLVRVLVPAQGSARQLQLGLLSYSASRSRSSPRRGFDQTARGSGGRVPCAGIQRLWPRRDPTSWDGGKTRDAPALPPQCPRTETSTAGRSAFRIAAGWRRWLVRGAGRTAVTWSCRQFMGSCRDVSA